MFLILSKKWTRPADPYLTFWRPDNVGYAWPLEWAGHYSKYDVTDRAYYYDNGYHTYAVPVGAAERRAEPAVIDGKQVQAVRNTRANWNALVRAARNARGGPVRAVA